MDRLPEQTATERLLLRRLTPADEPAMNAGITASLEHLRPWMPWASHEPLSAVDRLAVVATWEQEWRDGGDLIYGVFLGDDYIGNIGLHRRGTADLLEIGYWVHVDHTGHGYITEASEALTNMAFEQPGIDRVEIHNDRANVASGAVPRRLGFTLAREVAKEIDAPGETGVESQWAMTREEWTARTTATPT